AWTRRSRSPSPPRAPPPAPEAPALRRDSRAGSAPTGQAPHPSARRPGGPVPPPVPRARCPGAPVPRCPGGTVARSWRRAYHYAYIGVVVRPAPIPVTSAPALTGPLAPPVAPIRPVTHGAALSVDNLRRGSATSVRALSPLRPGRPCRLPAPRPVRLRP